MLDSTNLSAIKAAPTTATFPKFASNTSFNGGSYYVYVSNDLLDGPTSATDANNSITFTSIGYGPNKTTFAVVQGTYTYTYTAGGSNPNIVQNVNGAAGVVGSTANITTANNFTMANVAGHNSLATNAASSGGSGTAPTSYSQAQSPPFDTV